MPQLPQTKDLNDFQLYIKNLCQERGWDKNSHTEIFLLLTEELGELAKAIRNHTHLHSQDKNLKQETTKAELASELADVLNYVLDIANYFEIDMAEAFINKNKVNESREWH